MKNEEDGDTNDKWYTWDNLQKIGKETGRLQNKRTRKYQSNFCIIKIS